MKDESIDIGAHFEDGVEGHDDPASELLKAQIEQQNVKAANHADVDPESIFDDLKVMGHVTGGPADSDNEPVLDDGFDALNSMPHLFLTELHEIKRSIRESIAITHVISMGVFALIGIGFYVLYKKKV